MAKVSNRHGTYDQLIDSLNIKENNLAHLSCMALSSHLWMFKVGAGGS